MTVWWRENGELIATSHFDAGRRWVTVDQADPRILIAAELLDEEQFEPAWVVVQRIANDSLLGATIEIRAENGRWIYRITDYLAAPHCYVAEWPD